MVEMKPLSKLHEKSLQERQRLLAEACELTPQDQRILYRGTRRSDIYARRMTDLDLDDLGENIVGFYELPVRWAPNFVVDNTPRQLLNGVEERSCTAALSNFAKLTHQYSMTTYANKKFTLGQALLCDLPDVDNAAYIVESKRRELLELANRGRTHSRAYDLTVKTFPELPGKMKVQLEIDPSKAMGAGLAGSMMVALKPRLMELTGAKRVLGNVVSNASGCLVSARFSAPVDAMAFKGHDGAYVSNAFQDMSDWAQADPTRAPTHNKGIDNYVSGLFAITGQDWRAPFHANVALNGAAPYSSWRVEDGRVHGDVTMMIPCGTVLGEIDDFPKARVILDKVLKVRTPEDLARVAVAGGLGQNGGALFMLTTEYTTEGHGRHRSQKKPKVSA